MKITQQTASRRGQIVVLAAFAMVVVLGFCALAIDVMIVWLAQAQLQNAVDSAALAAATQMIGFVDDSAKQEARDLARTFAGANEVITQPLHLADSDIRFGRFNSANRQFIPEEILGPTEVIDSVWIRGRRTDASLDGPVGLFFARLFGIDRAQVVASAVATQARRFTMFVMDRSGSMCFDTKGVSRKYTSSYTGSTFLERQSTSSVYAYGPATSSRLEHFRKDVPGDVSSYAGWIWLPKYMLVNESRSIARAGKTPTTVSGLWRHVAYLTGRDSGTGQVVSDFVPSHVAARVSGERPQVRDYSLDASSRQVWAWKDWASWTVWGSSDPSRRDFRYCERDDPGTVESGWMRIPANVDLFGGYAGQSTDTRGHYFWSDSYGPVTAQCGYAVATQPLQPLQDSQDAAAEFITFLDHNKDRCGLVTYATNATMEYQLTNDWAGLTRAVQSYDPRGATNEAEGMRLANNELIDSPRAQGYGQRIMICLTDGNSNNLTNSDGTTTYYADGGPFTVTFNGKRLSCRIQQPVATRMEQEARRAANNGVKIYAVSFGDDADLVLHPEIAAMTNGAFYYAARSEDLREIFRDIFRRLPPLLTL